MKKKKPKPKFSDLHDYRIYKNAKGRYNIQFRSTRGIKQLNIWHRWTFYLGLYDLSTYYALEMPYARKHKAIDTYSDGTVKTLDIAMNSVSIIAESFDEKVKPRRREYVDEGSVQDLMIMDNL